MKALLAYIATAMKAVMRELASFVRVFCKRTGRWIVQRVVKPSIEYASQSVTAAAQAVVGFVPDVVRSGLKLPGQALRGTGAALEGGGRLVGATASAAATVPMALARGLAGGGGADMPPPPAPQKNESVEDALAAFEMASKLRAGVESRADELGIPLRPRPRPGFDRPASVEARTVLEFAAADRDERDLMDLDQTLPAHLQDWLYRLSEQQLSLLAKGGLERCEAAVAGRRCGIVGLPLPDKMAYEPIQPAATAGLTVGETLRDGSAFATRVAAAKGVRRDLHPQD